MVTPDVVFEGGDFRNVKSEKCSLHGLRIDGILATDLLWAYEARRQGPPTVGEATAAAD